MHNVKQNHPAVPGALTLKTWGFWNTQGPAMGDPQDFEIRPWFKVWSLLTQLFPAGSRIFKVSDPQSAEGIRAIASEVRIASADVWSVLLVNDHKNSVQTILRLPPASGSTWVLYRYTSDDCLLGPQRWRGTPKIRDGQQMRLTVPRNSVVFLTTRAVH